MVVILRQTTQQALLICLFKTDPPGNDIFDATFLSLVIRESSILNRQGRTRWLESDAYIENWGHRVVSLLSGYKVNRVH